MISGANGYVKLGAVDIPFSNWQEQITADIQKYRVFRPNGGSGPNFQLTDILGFSGQITAAGPYDQGNFPMVVGNLYEVHLGWQAGLELVMTARLGSVQFSNDAEATDKPGGQCQMTWESHGSFSISFT